MLNTNNTFNNANNTNNNNNNKPKKKSSEFVGNIITTVITPELIEAKLILASINPVIDSLEPIATDVAEIIAKLDNIIKVIPRHLENEIHKHKINRDLKYKLQDYIANKEIQILKESNLIGEVATTQAKELIQDAAPIIKVGGSSIKHIQRGGQQLLKRTAKSINEFLNSSVTASHIINMVKKGGRTKRRYNHHANKYKTRRQIG